MLRNKNGIYNTIQSLNYSLKAYSYYYYYYYLLLFLFLLLLSVLSESVGISHYN